MAIFVYSLKFLTRMGITTLLMGQIIRTEKLNLNRYDII